MLGDILEALLQALLQALLEAAARLVLICALLFGGLGLLLGWWIF